MLNNTMLNQRQKMMRSIQCIKWQRVQTIALFSCMFLLVGCADVAKDIDVTPTQHNHILLFPNREIKIVDQSVANDSDTLPPDRMPTQQLKNWARHTLRSKPDNIGHDTIMRFIIEDAALIKETPTQTKSWFVLDPGPTKYTIRYSVRLSVDKAHSNSENGNVRVEVEEVRFVPYGASEYRQNSELESGIHSAIDRIATELEHKSTNYLHAERKELY